MALLCVEDDSGLKRSAQSRHAPIYSRDGSDAPSVDQSADSAVVFRELLFSLPLGHPTVMRPPTNSI